MSWVTKLIDGDSIEMPDFTKDAAGHIVDLRGSDWRLNIAHSHAVLKWKRVGGCDDEAVAGLRIHVMRLIETRSGLYACTTFESVVRYLVTARDEERDALSLDCLLWYLAKLREKRSGFDFHRVRYWYIESANRALAGFSDDVAFSLQDLRIEGNAKGFAVLSLDPTEGPLSKFEEEALRSALIRGDGPIEERAALWLAFAYGANPANLALLREEDFTTHDFDGTAPSEHFLNMPRIKKRTPPRAEFKKRYVSVQLAAVIKELIQSNHSKFPNDTVRPLFRRPRENRILAQGPLRDYTFHYNAPGITDLVARCAERLSVCSPKTGKQIVLSTRRLRYTFACKLVRQGIGARELAELLDHTDLQNVQVYYKADSRMVERLDATVAKHLGPTIRAFMGEIIPSRGTTVDLIPFRDLPDLGQCGANFVCGLSAPKNCYTCVQFRAFKDGPHQSVLDSLLAERAELLNEGHEKIAEQLDRTILAAGEVVARVSNGAA